MEGSDNLKGRFSRMFWEGGVFEEGIAVIHSGWRHGGGRLRGAERRFVLISYVF